MMLDFLEIEKYNNTNIKIAIYSDDYEKVKSLLISLNKYEEYSELITYKGNLYAKLKNKNIDVFWLRMSDASRGHKWHFALVDRRSLEKAKNEDLLDCVIKPSGNIYSTVYRDSQDVKKFNEHILYF